MYHRVADLPYDPWGLAVTSKRFAEQMAVLKSERLPLSMSDFVEGLEDGTLPRHAVAVTFDDGYIDNLTHAKPILDRVGVPATIFLSTGQLGQKHEFWWDELARMIFGHRHGTGDTLSIAGQSIAARLPPLEFDASVRADWRAWQPSSTPREQLYLEVWQLLRNLGKRARADAMKKLHDVFHQSDPDPASFPMAREDVPLLTLGSEIEIGAHARSHEPLPALPLAERRQEIEGSREECEQLTGRAVKGFAYPYGDRDEETIQMVRDSGYEWACSTQDAVVDPDHFDRFDLPRRQVLDWDAALFERALSKGRPAA